MSNALHVHVDVEIAREPDDVWAVVGDYALDVRWRKGITEMTPDTPGLARLGTGVREVLRMAGSTYTTESVVTEFGPGLRYRFAGHGDGGAVTGGRQVRPGGRPGTAIFTYDVEVDPTGVPAVVRPVMGWWMQRAFEKDVTRLRKLVEADMIRTDRHDDQASVGR